jgi:hypothetical protein
MPSSRRTSSCPCVSSLPSRVVDPDLKVYSYDDIVKNHEVTYVAGGASQNAARGAAVGPAISPHDRDV